MKTITQTENFLGWLISGFLLAAALASTASATSAAIIMGDDMFNDAGSTNAADALDVGWGGPATDHK